MKLEILENTYKGTNTQARKSLHATEKYENLTQMEVLCIILKTYYELTFTKCPCHVRTGMKHKKSAGNWISCVWSGFMDKVVVHCIMKFLHLQGKAVKQIDEMSAVYKVVCPLYDNVTNSNGTHQCSRWTKEWQAVHCGWCK